MNTRLLKTKLPSIAAAAFLLIGASSFTLLSNAQTAPPPSIGEDTKGQPASTDETATPEKAETQISNKTANSQAKAEPEKATSPFGSATIKETRRENGQRYRVEMQHSAGAKQVLEETDSDGSLENTEKGIDDTPNLPKWKLGSW